MNTEQMKEIAEIIKTWNLNLDSQTAADIAKTLSPYLMWWMIKDFMLAVLGFATVFGCVATASRAVIKLIKH